MNDIPENTQTERRLVRATRFVNDYWIPCNPVTLKRIQNGLAQGTYNDAVDLLVKDITSDVALFTFCLRELLGLMKERHVIQTQPLNPIALMRSSGLQQLKEILGVKIAAVSNHKLASGSTLQVGRLQEVVMSATTAGELAHVHNIEDEMAYSAAVLRQLGLTLIAWNYSSMYQKAVAALKPDQSLDLVLTEKFGFSPTSLALKVLEQCGLSNDVCLSLGLDDDEPSYEEGHAVCSTLAKVCKVGEALARANNPEVYPSAKDDWIFAVQEVEAALGSDGIKVIQEKYEETCAHYVEYVPKLFKAGLVATITTLGGHKNPYLEQCSEDVRFELSKVYKTMVVGEVTEGSLRTLVKETIPNCGFYGGVIYTFEVGLGLLVPQTRVGQLKLIRVEPVDFSLNLPQNLPIIRAFDENEPIIVDGVGGDGGVISGISGYFGISQRMGVIYLEVAASLKIEKHHLTHFQAIAFTLSECLQT